MEAIITATAWGGEIMGRPTELGKVQPGYYADLILVDGNPLDDISLLSKHGRHMDMIMINGRVHKQLPKDYARQVIERSLAHQKLAAASGLTHAVAGLSVNDPDGEALLEPESASHSGLCARDT